MQALERTDHVLRDPAPAVCVSDYGESAIEYPVDCWTPAESYLSVKFALCENLRPAFEEHGVEMTYNHLNIHIMDRA